MAGVLTQPRGARVTFGSFATLLSFLMTTALVVFDPAAVTAQRRAPDAVERARDHMEAGQDLYLQGRFVEAAEEFQRAFEAQPFSAFLYNAGVAYERHGDATRAADFFTRYLESDPNVEDAAGVRGRIERLRGGTAAVGTVTTTTDPNATGTTTGTTTTGTTTTGTETTTGTGTTETGTTTGTVTPTETGATGTAAVRDAEIPPDMKSLLSVRTDPSGAQVTVRQGNQTVAVGPAPFAQTLDSGSYRLIVQHPDYRTVEETIRIRPGRVYVIIVEMSQGQFLGYLRVISNVPGASVFVDDREAGALGHTPFQNVIATGAHRVWIERPGYRVEERNVEIGLGEDVKLQVELQRVAHGRIRVVSNVRGAEVYVDDRLVGAVPYEGDVPAGVRSVRIEADGMKDWEEDVTVNRGQVTPLRVRLRPSVGRGGAWVTSSIAVGLLAGGIVLGVLSNNLEDELSQDRDEGRLATNDPRLLRGQLLAVGADVAFGLSAVLGGLAVYYFLRDPLPDSEGRVLPPRDWAIVPSLLPNRASLDMEWSF